MAGQRASESVLRFGVFAGILLLLLTPFVVTPSTIFPFVIGKAVWSRAIIEIIFALWAALALANTQCQWLFNVLGDHWPEIRAKNDQRALRPLEWASCEAEEVVRTEPESWKIHHSLARLFHAAATDPEYEDAARHYRARGNSPPIVRSFPARCVRRTRLRPGGSTTAATNCIGAGPKARDT